MAKERKIRKIEPYTRKWEKLANELARTYQTIRPCKHCGYPVIDGYCCQTCGSDTP
jgi:recombinational DNA repair protein RecR